MKKEIALGTWSWGSGAAGGDQVFGNHLTAENLQPIFDQAMEAGLNIWDTAAVYGMGSSETILGEFVKQYPREKIAMAWAIAKNTLPIIGVTKSRHIEEAVGAAKIVLTEEEIRQLEYLAENTAVDTKGAWEAPMI